MAISVFDLFKIGIGPSSSHTVGPMRAANDFVESLRGADLLERVARIEVQLYGSLSATGIGHGTDRAVIMGLMGERPEHIDPAIISPCIEELLEAQALLLDGRLATPFVWARDMQLYEHSLPHHPNAMRLIAHGHAGELYRNTYYSVGGGFVIDERQAQAGELDSDTTRLPYDFDSAAELLALCRLHGLRISELMLANEQAWRDEQTIRDGLWRIWEAMRACVDQGFDKEGMLPGVPPTPSSCVRGISRMSRSLVHPGPKGLSSREVARLE